MSTVGMETLVLEIFPRVEPPGISLLFVKVCVAEEGGGESVSGVFLLGIEFNDDASIQARRVYGIGIFSMIRMERVAVVGGNHEASGNHGLCFVIAVTQRTGDPCQCILEEGGTGALICGAANFFIIEKGVNADMLFLFSCGESTERGESALKVIQPGGRNKFMPLSPQGSLYTGIKVQVMA